jgi:hypothetical protein
MLTSTYVDVDELLANPTDPDKLKRRFAPVEISRERATASCLAEDLIRKGAAVPRLSAVLHAGHAVELIVAGTKEKGWTVIDYQNLAGSAAHE